MAVDLKSMAKGLADLDRQSLLQVLILALESSDAVKGLFVEAMSGLDPVEIQKLVDKAATNNAEELDKIAEGTDLAGIRELFLADLNRGSRNLIWSAGQAFLLVESDAQMRLGLKNLVLSLEDVPAEFVRPERGGVTIDLLVITIANYRLYAGDMATVIKALHASNSDYLRAAIKIADIGFISKTDSAKAVADAVKVTLETVQRVSSTMLPQVLAALPKLG